MAHGAPLEPEKCLGHDGPEESDLRTGERNFSSMAILVDSLHSYVTKTDSRDGKQISTASTAIMYEDFQQLADPEAIWWVGDRLQFHRAN